MALARFALFPDDDLTLAALLKSPFCGLDDDGLYALANGSRAGDALGRPAAPAGRAGRLGPPPSSFLEAARTLSRVRGAVRVLRPRARPDRTPTAARCGRAC